MQHNELSTHMTSHEGILQLPFTIDNNISRDIYKAVTMRPLNTSFDLCYNAGVWQTLILLLVR